MSLHELEQISGFHGLAAVFPPADLDALLHDAQAYWVAEGGAIRLNHEDAEEQAWAAWIRDHEAAHLRSLDAQFHAYTEERAATAWDRAYAHEASREPVSYL